jgi:hypothetical protein
VNSALVLLIVIACLIVESARTCHFGEEEMREASSRSRRPRLTAEYGSEHLNGEEYVTLAYDDTSVVGDVKCCVSSGTVTWRTIINETSSNGS